MTRERLLGGLYGLLVGDALGVPYEFHPASSLADLPDLEFDPPVGFPRSHAGTPPGSWSDDGAQALCLLASLLHRGELDLEDFARRLRNWYSWGYLAAEGRVFDVGVQTQVALAALESGRPARVAGPASERDNGNGSLMRVLPLALWHTGTNAELFQQAREQSLPTHGHLRSQLCCGLYCLWARFELEGVPEAWSRATSEARRLLADEPGELAELEQHIRPDGPFLPTGSGYVVDSLHSALVATSEPNYAAVIRRAISFGNDTDTTAALAGGIAGIRFGVSGIPRRWLDGLRDRQAVEPLAARLFTLRKV